MTLTFAIVSCSPGSKLVQTNYEFIKEYTTTITVGGVVGVTERTFKTGETFGGNDLGNGLIKIRIAEHTKQNEDCPNSWCYQEFLEVSNEFLKRIE